MSKEAAVVVLPKLDLNVEAAARQFATVAAILAGVRMAYLLFVLFYRLLIRRSPYALVIETAGTQYTALHGTDYDEIYRIEGEIVNAIEDPPAHERIVHVGGDLVIGDKVGRDKYQQRGHTTPSRSPTQTGVPCRAGRRRRGAARLRRPADP